MSAFDLNLTLEMDLEVMEAWLTMGPRTILWRRSDEEHIKWCIEWEDE